MNIAKRVFRHFIQYAVENSIRYALSKPNGNDALDEMDTLIVSKSQTDMVDDVFLIRLE